MKYKAGDKFIIEIEKTGKTIAKIKGFRTLVFDDYGLDKLEQVQEHDGCDGCKCASKDKNEYPCSDCMHNYMDRWERKTEEIQVGDEVENDVGCKGVVFYISESVNNDGFVQVLRKDACAPLVCTWSIELCHRTGKTYPDLIAALEELPKEGE